MLHFRQSSVNAARGSRRTTRVALAEALLWSVQAHAAPGVGDDSALRGKDSPSSQPARLVSGDPAQVNAVVAGGPGPTAILAITPVPAKVGSYPPGTTIVGNELRAYVGGFRAWFEVQLSNWDPDDDNVPALKVFQVKIDCAGYMSGKGAPLDVAFVRCTNDAAGDALCGAAFGESWTKCDGGTCRAAYLDKSGTKRPADNWCAEVSAGSGESCDSSEIVSEDPCYQNEFFAVYLVLQR